MGRLLYRWERRKSIAALQRKQVGESGGRGSRREKKSTLFIRKGQEGGKEKNQGMTYS